MKYLCFASVTILLYTLCTHAQTFVSGSVSGTWTAAGNPYIVVNNITVAGGEQLTIHPGVKVVMNSGLDMTVLGKITAVGTRDSTIQFAAPNGTTRWGRIYVVHAAGQKSTFSFCDIRDATVGIDLSIQGQRNDTMSTEISNCKFSQCSVSGVTGQCQGISSYSMCCCYPNFPHLNPMITSCVFDETVDGCVFLILGHYQNCGGGGGVISRGQTAPIVTNNVFKNLSGIALRLTIGAYPGNSFPQFTNNIVLNSSLAVDAMSPYDVLIENNIFSGLDSAIRRADPALSSIVAYNCFFQTNIVFSGYPNFYGQLITQNRNGTASDVLYNIITNPGLNDSNYSLIVQSPCIDAGDSSSVFADVCRPPGKDSEINDMGVHGGPGACAWLDTTVTAVYESRHVMPNQYALSQNYPNPFNPSTRISFALPFAQFASLKVFDVLGREVATLVNEHRNPGNYEVEFDGGKLPSGIYFYRLQAGSFAETKKFLLLK